MVIVETSIFTRRVTELLADEEYRLLQATLLARQDAGPVIPGGGGLRKIRWVPQVMGNAAAHGSSIIGPPHKTVS